MEMIAKFNNVEIYPDYNKPVVHAWYEGEMATFDIVTCQIVEGSIQRYIIIIIVIWIVKHQGDLWDMFKKKKFKYIPTKDF